MKKKKNIDQTALRIKTFYYWSNPHFYTVKLKKRTDVDEKMRMQGLNCV